MCLVTSSRVKAVAYNDVHKTRKQFTDCCWQLFCCVIGQFKSVVLSFWEALMGVTITTGKKGEKLWPRIDKLVFAVGSVKA